MASADEIQEVRPGLFFWQAYEPAVKVDLSCCARQTAEGLVFIDPIPLRKDAERELLAHAEPRAIILTSGHHARAAEDYRQRFSIPIHAHAEAEAELGLKIDHALADEDVALGEFTVVTLPGAAVGEIALFAGDTLHLGDALIHLPPLPFGPLPDKYCTDPRELRRSLGKLLRFPFEVLTFAHGLPIVAHARQRLTQLLA
jgi:glyoxylase-like metal-dependent hydrolase (beta-lactamase superfamily II)